MVVIALMGLVAPLAINQVTKTSDHVELLELKKMLKHLSIKAFYTGQNVEVSFKEQQVQVLYDGLSQQHSFSAISFPKQSIKFNRNGIADKLMLSLEYRGRPITIESQDGQSW